MTVTIAGTFSAGSNSVGDGDMQSGVLVIGSTLSGNALLSSEGTVDTNNKFRTQKSTDNGATWANVAVINTLVTNQTVAVVAGEQWRISSVNVQARKSLGYKLTLEN